MTSIFSRSTSRLHFDEISTSKRRRVPAGKTILIAAERASLKRASVAAA